MAATTGSSNLIIQQSRGCELITTGEKNIIRRGGGESDSVGTEEEEGQFSHHNRGIL
ncbi:hypothetical protein ACLOJK_037228, partial [Asimina triloba]